MILSICESVIVSMTVHECFWGVHECCFLNKRESTCVYEHIGCVNVNVFMCVNLFMHE